MDIVPIIDVHQNNGVLVTTSRNIAEVFGKEHRNVLADVRAVCEDNPDKDFTTLNFQLSEHTDKEVGQLNFEDVTHKDTKGKVR